MEGTMKYSINYLETIPEMFGKSMKENKDQDLFYYKKDKNWLPVTYSEARDKIELIAMALRKLGFEKDDKIALQSENRPEWTMIDFACAHFGFVTVPIYPTLLPDQCKYIIKNSDAKLYLFLLRNRRKRSSKLKSTLKM